MQDGSSSSNLLSHLPALLRKLGSSATRVGEVDARRVLIVGDRGLEGDAVVSCVALRMSVTYCSCHEGLTYLLRQNSTLTVSPPRKPSFVT